MSSKDIQDKYKRVNFDKKIKNILKGKDNENIISTNKKKDGKRKTFLQFGENKKELNKQKKKKEVIQIFQIIKLWI